MEENDEKRGEGNCFCCIEWFFVKNVKKS